ncbi:MAG: AI-2E family transporter [Nitrococcus mobilis]|nr:AI-2E family transporter [Nitrococcus mobilis]
MTTPFDPPDLRPETDLKTRLPDRRAWPLLLALALGGVLVYLLRPILMPFLTGALLAYLADPLADRLERLRLQRTAAVIVVFTGLSLVGVGALLLLLPILGSQIDSLRSLLPQMVDWVYQIGLPWLRTHAGVDIESLDFATLRGAIAEHWQSTGSLAAQVIAQATSSGLALAGLLANLALIPVVAFYLLRDWDVLIARIRDLLPRRMEPSVSALASECNEVVAAFLRGQLLVMLALGVIYAFGLWLIGLDLALLVGLLAGIASIVPYLGFIVGIGSAALATVFQFSDWLMPLGLVCGVFLVGQLLESLLLTPLLVGDRIGLHPVAVIFAVLAGGQLFGFTGVLLALPIAAIVMVLLRHAHDRYLRSSLYDEPRVGDEQEGSER